MSKTFEMSFQIAGKMASSFSSAFSSASSKMDDLKDKTKQTQRALSQLDSQFAKGKIHQAQYKQATKELTNELKRLERASESISFFQTGFTNGLNTVRQTAGMAALGTSAAAAGTAFSTLKKSMSFEAQLDSIKAVTGITDKELKKVRAESLEQGMSTKYSALEAAQGFEELLKAGVSLETVLDDGLNSALNLATAGNLELAEAAEILSDGLNGFKKDGMTAAEVANTLSGAASASSTGVRDIQYGLAAAGAVADGLDVSFKEVNATLAMFSNNAVKGSDAGTSLKTFLSYITPKTEDATEAFKKFGLINKQGQNIMFDSTGGLKDMSEVAGILQEKFKDLNAQQRQDVFYTMFGSDGIRAASILYKEGAAGVEKMYKEMSKVTALSVAKEKMDNAAGAVEQLSGAFETMQIVAAEKSLPIVKGVALELAETIEGSADKTEEASARMSSSMERIFQPFLTKTPEELAALKNDPTKRKEYEEELKKIEKYENMDLSDKFLTSAETAIDELGMWLEGPGGEKVSEIFSKLGEIAANTWWNALTNSVKASAANIAEGNIGAGVGLGLAAWAMGGGLLVQGAMAAGKGGKALFDKVRPSKGDRAADKTLPPVDVPEKATTKKQKEEAQKAPKKEAEKAAASCCDNKGKDKKSKKSADRTPSKDKTPSKPAPKKSSGGFLKGAISKTGNVLSKAVLPLTAAVSAFNISKSEDKKKTAAKEVSGIAAGAGGAKLGAAIGTAMVPGLGTVIGTALGGLVGYAGGNWAGGKAVDAVRQPAPAPAPAAATAAQPTQPSQASNAAVSQASTQLVAAMNSTTSNFKLLTMYSGQASGMMVGSFMSLKSSVDGVKSNLDILTSYVGIASGWFASLNGVQSAGQGVIEALNSLAERINSTPAPNVSGGGSGKRTEMK